jgi:hypothetical protein
VKKLFQRLLKHARGIVAFARATEALPEELSICEYNLAALITSGQPKQLVPQGKAAPPDATEQKQQQNQLRRSQATAENSPAAAVRVQRTAVLHRLSNQ